MWFLNKTTQSLKAITLEAATTDLDFTVVYHLKNGRLNIGPQTDIGTIDENLTTVVPAPGTDVGSDVKNIVVVNTDNINHTLVFYFNDGVDKEIFRCVLEPDWCLTWEQEFGWLVYDEQGRKIANSVTTSVDFVNILGDPYDNVNLAAALNALVVGLWDDRGVFDASVNAYPSAGGSGTAGAILKGDIWTVSVAGVLPNGQVVEIGDTVRALVDAPGNVQADWAILQTNIGYVPEDVVNKDTDGTLAANSDVKYPSQKAVKTYVDNKVFTYDNMPEEVELAVVNSMRNSSILY